MALEKVKDIVSNNLTVVFGKSTCPYCETVKDLLQKLGASVVVVHVDKESDGSQLLPAITEWTGRRKLPSVFIGGEIIGGLEATSNKHKDGKLVPLLRKAGAIASKSGTGPV